MDRVRKGRFPPPRTTGTRFLLGPTKERDGLRMSIGRAWADRVSQKKDSGAGGRDWSGIALVVALIALAIAQLVPPLGRALATYPGQEFISETDDLSAVSVRLVDGTDVGLVGDQATLLLVFDPDCPHSDRVAPVWSAWLSNLESERIRVLAVSPGLSGVASAYASEQRWSVEVGTLEAAAGSIGGNAITKRTPWVFAVDRSGRVISHGHGAQLPEIARSLVDRG